jgi:hypothetical protein
MQYGQCNKDFVWREISLYKFLIPKEVRLMTQHFMTRSFSMKIMKALIEKNMAEMHTIVSALWCVLYRQAKNYTSKFQNCSVFTAGNHELIIW